MVDVFEAVDVRLEAGVEDHVLHHAARKVVARGVQEEVGLLAREAQGERELDGCALAVADALGVAVAVCSGCGEADCVGRPLLVASGVASASSPVTPEVMRTSSLVIVV